MYLFFIKIYSFFSKKYSFFSKMYSFYIKMYSFFTKIYSFYSKMYSLFFPETLQKGFILSAKRLNLNFKNAFAFKKQKQLQLIQKKYLYFSTSLESKCTTKESSQKVMKGLKKVRKLPRRKIFLTTVKRKSQLMTLANTAQNTLLYFRWLFIAEVSAPNTHTTQAHPLAPQQGTSKWCKIQKLYSPCISI